jgi:hypothetical protein
MFKQQGVDCDGRWKKVIPTLWGNMVLPQGPDDANTVPEEYYLFHSLFRHDGSKQTYRRTANNSREYSSEIGLLDQI